MPLSGPQTTKLVTALNEERTWAQLAMIADAVDEKLGDLPQGLSKYQAIVTFVTKVNTSSPPRDVALLEYLQTYGNARLKAVASELLAPGYFSPSGDPHDAILLGPLAFVDREDLRTELRKFTNSDAYSTHVLIVSGDEPCGKSYSWEFLRHLAVATVGATARRLRLRNTGWTPRELVGEVFGRLRLDKSGLPAMTDDPQLARIEPLISEFTDRLDDVQRPSWLVIDDINDASVLPPTRETALALAQAVEENKPDKLWLALLGYNATINDPDLRFVARDDPRFPDPECVAVHFRSMANVSPKKLSEERALELAALLFSKYDPLDKAAMIELTPELEEMGEKLKRGEQPWND